MKTVRGLIYTAEGTFEYGQISIAGNKIVKVIKCPKESLSDTEQHQIIIPGLIDIHMHGACGKDICSCDSQGLNAIVDYEKKNGITSCCMATMTLDKASLISICNKISAASKENNAIKGIYMEGPFIAKARAGAQNPEHVLAPDYDVYRELQDASNNMIKIITVAPEIPGAPEFIEKLYSENDKCKVSIAHTSASAIETREAILRGAKHITHLYNAMTPMSHRGPGVAGEAADHEEVMVELICDGVHVDPVMIRNTFKLFGANRIILISDSMEATGMADGKYMLGDLPVQKCGNRAVLVGNKDAKSEIGDDLQNATIAGSVTNLFNCMQNAIRYGVRLEDAIMTVTTNPAKEIGIYDQVGSLEAGKRADVLILNDKFELCSVITCEDDVR